MSGWYGKFSRLAYGFVYLRIKNPSPLIKIVTH